MRIGVSMTTSTDDNCLFCQIVAGDIPSTTLYSDDAVVAFRDVAPVAPTHIVIVPRLHIVDAAAVESEHGPLLVAMVLTAQRLAVSEGIDQSGYRLVFNIGDDAGNSVPHLHLHLIGGREMAWPPG